LASIPTSYLYTFVAILAVSTLLTSSFVTYTNAVRFSSERKQLGDLMNQVSAKGTELITTVLTSNATIEAYIQMPEMIGNKHYWLQLGNDSVSAWLQGGFGDRPVDEPDSRVYLPKGVLARGYFTGGNGAVHLSCNFTSGVQQLLLSGSDAGV
jgi:hypothetical protein